MQDKQERTRGITLTTLVLDDVVAEVQRNAEANETVELVHQPYAAVEVVGGLLYVVCHEGVGWQVSEQEPLELPLHVRTPTGFGMFPRWIANLSPAEVRAHMTGEPIDLADLVRSFGARLEANFWLWHRTLAGVSV